MKKILSVSFICKVLVLFFYLLLFVCKTIINDLIGLFNNKMRIFKALIYILFLIYYKLQYFHHKFRIPKKEKHQIGYLNTINYEFR
jgi:hypothetical protein